MVGQPISGNFWKPRHTGKRQVCSTAEDSHCVPMHMSEEHVSFGVSHSLLITEALR